MKKLPYLLVIIIYLTGNSLGFCQNPNMKRTNHWYFGNGAGLDFSNGNIVSDTTGHLFTGEGCSSISDTAGNLLFYTDGDTVWNSQHVPMPNGTGLIGCGNHGGSSAQHLIVPHPASDSLFYIFTNDCAENAGIGGFNYSVVDLSLNGGLGDVTTKNSLLFAPSTEGVTSTIIKGELGYWVTTHEFNSNRFFSYRIDSLGLATNPVISIVGAIYTYPFVMLKFSPDGKKLASAPFMVLDDQIFEFDDSTGIVYNPITIDAISGEYSPCFSPDNTKLYFMNSGNIILQYCISNYDSISINESRNIVSTNIDNSAFGAITNGSDGKLYLSSLFHDSISTMEFPNLYGTPCQVIYHNVGLGGKFSLVGLPNFVEHYFYNDTLQANLCDSTTGIESYRFDNEIKIYPNPAKDFTKIDFINQEINFQIELTDAFGRIILSEKNKGSSILNTSGLKNGIYLLTVTNEYYHSHQKIIINH